jgi:hypothetical protein
VLVLAPDADECAVQVARALEDHDADFDGFVFLEPLEDRVARGVVDPDWAAFANELDGAHRVGCSNVYDPDELVRPIRRDEGMGLWVGWLVCSDGAGPDENLGAIATASSGEEYRATVADYVERMGLEVGDWRHHEEVLHPANGAGVIDTFSETAIFTSSTSPEIGGDAVWRGTVEISNQDGGVGGAFVVALASASSRDDFEHVARRWFGHWGSNVVSCDDVEPIADLEHAPAFVHWVRDHFGFFHGTYHEWSADEDG